MLQSTTLGAPGILLTGFRPNKMQIVFDEIISFALFSSIFSTEIK